jgi:hypothetical protein
VLEALYCAASWCLQRGATSKVGEEAGPPGPRGLIEAKCQYRGEGGERVSVLAVVPTTAGGLPPPFIGQGEAAYNRAAQSQLRVAVQCTVL